MAEKAQIKLSKAAAAGDAQCIESLLHSHPKMNLNAPTPLQDDPIGPGADYGLTALHRAVMGNHVDAVRMLLKAGASHLVKTAAGKIPEDFAAGVGRKTVRRIFQDFKKRLAKPACTRAQGRNAVLATRLAAAVNNMNIHMVRKWLDAGASVLRPSLCEHDFLKVPVPAAHRAAWLCDPLVLEMLLRKSKTAAVAKDCRNYTALHYLATQQKWPSKLSPAALRCFKLLLAAGAKPDAKNDKGKTPGDILGFLTPSCEHHITLACLFADAGSQGNLTKVLESLCNDPYHFDSHAAIADAARKLAEHGADPEVLTGFYRIQWRRAEYIAHEDVTFVAVKPAIMPEGNQFVGLRGRRSLPSGNITYAQMTKLAVTPPSVAPFFSKLVKELKTAPWTPKGFKQQPQATQQRVRTVLRCALRLSRQNNGYHLPPELWIVILGCIPRNTVRWPWA